MARVRCCCELALWVSFTLWLAAQRTGVVRLYLGIVRKAQEFVSGSGSGAVSSVVNLYFPTGNNDKKLTYVNCTLTPEDEVETWGDLSWIPTSSTYTICLGRNCVINMQKSIRRIWSRSLGRTETWR